MFRFFNSQRELFSIPPYNLPNTPTHRDTALLSHALFALMPPVKFPGDFHKSMPSCHAHLSIVSIIEMTRKVEGRVEEAELKQNGCKWELERPSQRALSFFVSAFPVVVI